MANKTRIVLIFKITGFVILALLASIIIAGVVQTYRVEHRPEQAEFRSGSLPNPLPDGFYKGGQRTGFGADWLGKIFDQKNQSGVNKFTDGQKFTFKTYEAKGLRDNKQVLRIDYNQKGNPWWLHFITDEIVQVDKNKYLGKVHLRVIPGLTFTLTYFTLQK